MPFAGLLAGAVVLGVAAAVTGPLALVPLVAGAALVAIVRVPGAVLGAYLLIPFYKGFAQEFVPVDLTLLLAVANTLSLGAGVVLGERLRLDAAGVALWTLLTLAIVAGTLYAPDPDLAQQTLLGWTALVAIPLLAVLRVGSDERAVRQLLWATFGFGCLVTVLGVLSLTPDQRLTVLGANTIGVARAALMVPIIAVGFVIHTRLWPVALVVMPLALVVALASGARGPVVALTVVSVAAGVARLRRGGAKRLVLGGAPLAAAAVAAIIALAPPEISLNRFDVLLAAASGESMGDVSVSARVFLYDLAVTMFVDRPLVGQGLGAFATLPLPWDYPHNLLLQIAAELGLLGAVVVIVLLWRAARRPRPGAAWATVGALALFYTVNAMVSGDAYADRTVWGFLLLLALASHRTAPRTLDRAENRDGGDAHAVRVRRNRQTKGFLSPLRLGRSLDGTGRRRFQRPAPTLARAVLYSERSTNTASNANNARTVTSTSQRTSAPPSW